MGSISERWSHWLLLLSLQCAKTVYLTPFPPIVLYIYRIIRLNPDVLIRNDQWLLQQMNNPELDGIFQLFYPKNNRGKKIPFFHTDFYAFRPHAANATVFANSYKTHGTAEENIQPGFATILKNKRWERLPGAVSQQYRLVGQDCDVVHIHSMVKECPNYFDKHNATLLY